MSHRRGFMCATLHPVRAPAVSRLRLPTVDDEDALAKLMLDAYRGTIDHDEGEGEAEALLEVRRTLSGSKGPCLWSACRVVEREGKLASAALVIRWQGEPLVAFTMTAAAVKHRGLARACMLGSMRELYANGERRLGLFVTLANAEALALYRSLGFELQQ
jgi:hypothetical protein